VDKEAYLLELTRYVVFKPVGPGMGSLPEQWPWSSYPIMMGDVVGDNVDVDRRPFGAIGEGPFKNSSTLL